MIKMIVACDNNNAIGYEGGLLCHNSEDLQYFKKVTSGQTVVMGRKTFDSLPFGGRGLPNRDNYVLTGKVLHLDKLGYLTKDTHTECNLAWLETGLRYGLLGETTWVIGGCGLYHSLNQVVDEVHVTRIDESFEKSDTYVNLDFLSEFEMTSCTRLNDYSVVEVWNRLVD